MYEPLHHKYRPQTFAQLVGQGAIAQTLTHALQQNRIAPAYLFCGPRGTGKTSSARILAKSLNCLASQGPTPTPCGQCDLCRAVSTGSALDIVEIDAASNTGVDNIRELIERAQFAPVQCRYKVYVIDECHMLSTAAFNALLKTLEEPPERVVFVLATTDPQRVLPTIISRCQRFDFRRIPLPAMIKHLTYIAQQESIEINEAALQLVAQIAQGGLRDAESLLDQLSLRADEITVEAVWDLVGAVPERDLLNLVRAIAADDGTVLIERTRNLMDKGREPLIVLQSLVGFYRDLLIAKSAPARADMVAITPPTWAEMTEFSQKLSVPQLLASQQTLQSAEVQIKNTTQPRLWLEITLTSLLPSALGAIAQVATVGSAPRNISNPPRLKESSSPLTEPNHLEQVSPPKTKPSEEATALESVATKSVSSAEETVESPAESSPISEKSAANNEFAFGRLEDLWTQILKALEPRGTQMLMSQQGALLAFDGVSAKVGFRSAKLQKMAQQRIPNLEKALESIFQRPIKVLLEVQPPTEDAQDSSQKSAPQKSAPLKLEQERSAPLKLEQETPADSSPSLPSSPPPSAPPKRSPSAPSNGSSPKPSIAASPDQWATNQDQDNIKRFAQFFNGQIVSLDDEDDLMDNGRDNSSGKKNQRSQKSVEKSSEKSSDPGPDVPF